MATACAGLLMSITSLSVDLYMPSLPAVGRDLSTGAAAMQLTLSAFFAGLAAGQLFYGVLSDRFGRMVPLVIGLLLYIVASIACARATDVVSLVVRLVQALGACAAAAQCVSGALVASLYATLVRGRAIDGGSDPGLLRHRCCTLLLADATAAPSCKSAAQGQVDGRYLRFSACSWIFPVR